MSEKRGVAFKKSGAVDAFRILIAGIAVVFALILLAVLYIYFSDRFGNAATPSGVTITNPTGSIKTSAGVAEPIYKQCQDACNSGDKPNFCDFSMRFNGLSVTCKDLATNSQYSQYNVQACPSIDCTPAPTTQQASTTCAELSGTWKTPTSDGKCPMQDGKNGRKRTPSEQPPATGQICCYYT